MEEKPRFLRMFVKRHDLDDSDNAIDLVRKHSHLHTETLLLSYPTEKVSYGSLNLICNTIQDPLYAAGVCRSKLTT